MRMSLIPSDKSLGYYRSPRRGLKSHFLNHADILGRKITMTSLPKIFSLLLVVLAFGLIQCGSEKSRVDYLHIATLKLESGQASAAVTIFDDILADDPNEPTALYGKLLGTLQEPFELAQRGLGKMPELIAQSQTLNLHDIQNMLDEMLTTQMPQAMLGHRARRLLDIATRLLAQGDVALYLSDFPLVLSDQITLHIHGEFDRADATLLQALAQLVLGLENVGLALNWQFDTEVLYGKIPPEPEFIDILAFFQKNFRFILTDPASADFLTLRPDGPARFQEAIRQFITGLTEIGQSFQLSLSETDNQYDDVVRLYKSAPPAAHTTGPALAFNGRLPLDPTGQEKFFQAIIDSLQGQSLFDIAAFGSLLQSFLRLPYNLILPTGCQAWDLKALFSTPDPDGLRDNAVGWLEQLDRAIPLVENVIFSLDFFNQKLKSDPNMQAMLKLTATKMEQCSSANLAEVIEQISQTLKSLKSIMSLVKPDAGARYEAIVDILKTFAEIDPDSLTTFFHASGQYVAVLLDSFREFPAPPAKVDSATLLRLWSRHSLTLLSATQEIIPPFLTMLQTFAQPLSTWLENQSISPERLDLTTCLIFQTKIEE
jgi:hypothetical protein